MQVKRRKGWRMSCDVGEVTERLGNELCSFSNLSVTAHSPTLPLLHLRHSLFPNPSFASPTSQALHLIHPASRPWRSQELQLSLEVIANVRDSQALNAFKNNLNRYNTRNCGRDRQLKQQGLWLRDGRPGLDPGRRRVVIFLHSFISRQALGVTQPPIK